MLKTCKYSFAEQLSHQILTCLTVIVLSIYLSNCWQKDSSQAKQTKNGQDIGHLSRRWKKEIQQLGRGAPGRRSPWLAAVSRRIMFFIQQNNHLTRSGIYAEGTPELTAKRKRGRPAKARPQDLDEHSEGNAKRKRAKQRHSKKVADEEEADIVTSPSLQPSRRSSRVATSAKKVYKEIDEVEDDAEESDVVVEEDTPLTKSFAKASTTVHATPSATYKRRKSRTPLIGQDTGSQNDSETQDEETTPKATYSSARNVKGRTGDVERNFEEFDDLQSTKHAEPCGTKRGRAGARSPAVTRNVAMASRTGSRSPDRGITPEPTLSEDDFVSSPEIVSRKRVRVG